MVSAVLNDDASDHSEHGELVTFEECNVVSAPPLRPAGVIGVHDRFSDPDANTAARNEVPVLCGSYGAEAAGLVPASAQTSGSKAKAVPERPP